LVVVGPAGPTMTNILSFESMMMHRLANPKYYVIKNVTYFGSRWSKSRKHNSRVSCDR